MISYFKLSTEITFLEWLLLFFLILINFIFLTAWNWYHLFILAQNYFIIQETAISGNIWGVCYKSIWGRKSFIIVDNFNITVVGIGDGDRVCYWSGFSCVCFFFFFRSCWFQLSSEYIYHDVWMCVLIRSLTVGCWLFDLIYWLENSIWNSGWLIKFHECFTCVSIICTCGPGISLLNEFISVNYDYVT